MYGKIKSKLPNVRKWVSIEVHCTSHLTVFYFIIRIIVRNMMLLSLYILIQVTAITGSASASATGGSNLLCLYIQAGICHCC